MVRSDVTKEAGGETGERDGKGQCGRWEQEDSFFLSVRRWVCRCVSSVARFSLLSLASPKSSHSHLLSQSPPTPGRVQVDSSSHPAPSPPSSRSFLSSPSLHPLPPCARDAPRSLCLDWLQGISLLHLAPLPRPPLPSQVQLPPGPPHPPLLSHLHTCHSRLHSHWTTRRTPHSRIP